MSDDARTLLYWADNYRTSCAADSDRQYCRCCAREWAAHIIGRFC